MREKQPAHHLPCPAYGITPACAGKTLGLGTPLAFRWDHPPPRVRGKLNHREAGEPCAGITPAYAGKTNSSQFCHPIHWDHPRVCGKTLFSKRSCGGHVGSPPRVREKRVPTIEGTAGVRITPACAGKTAML